MKATDDLFQLIKAMSKTEKGYFKKFASKQTIGSKNVYVRLFEAIELQNEYDEEQIKTKFKGEKFAATLYSTKNYLFNLVLKSLSAYHSEKFAVSKLNNILTELNVLFEKGLYKQFKTLLNKAIEIAKENDKPFYLALLYNKEMTALTTDYYTTEKGVNFEELKKRSLDNLRSITVNEEYNLLYNELFLLSKEMGSIRTKSDLDRLNLIANNPLLRGESKADNFDAKFKHYSILGHYYRIVNDNKSWIKYRKALLDLLESDKRFIRENPRSYVLALNNYLNACVIQGFRKEFENGIQKLKNFAAQFENRKEFIDLQTRTFLLVSDLELTYNIKFCLFGKIIRSIEDINKGLERFSRHLQESRKLSLYNKLAYACFIMNDLERGLHYISRILNSKDAGKEPEQHSIARIKNLIIHFESGNYDHLEYAVKSTKRYLSKAERFHGFEKTVLAFVTKAMNTNDEKTKMEIFGMFKKDLIKLKADPFERNAIEQFDMISWAEGKMKKRPFAEILAEKTEVPD
ncbi:MAG: hypothetical protein K8I03_16480 [Ignavibacteria bacterium]|nr:hypothetical protein [Ignavibacteria bacterium]